MFPDRFYIYVFTNIDLKFKPAITICPREIRSVSANLKSTDKLLGCFALLTLMAVLALLALNTQFQTSVGFINCQGNSLTDDQKFCKMKTDSGLQAMAQSVAARQTFTLTHTYVPSSNIYWPHTNTLCDLNLPKRSLGKSISRERKDN